MPRSVSNLGEWRNDPYVTDPVAAFLKFAEIPMLMREVAEGSSIPIRCANRVLFRLHASGRAKRYKLAIRRPGFCHKRKACIPAYATRLLYVYSWAGPNLKLKSI